jgi:hypothetical protein
MVEDDYVMVECICSIIHNNAEVKGFMFTISQWLLQPLDRLNFDG